MICGKVSMFPRRPSLLVQQGSSEFYRPEASTSGRFFFVLANQSSNSGATVIRSSNEILISVLIIVITKNVVHFAHQDN